MKFDFVIGNPPYQQETSEEITTNGQKSRKNIFHHFQIAADDISRGGSILVFPGGRWIHQSGKGLKQFGLDLINDRRLSRLVFYPRSRDIFTNTDIPDGISIVVMRQDNDMATIRLGKPLELRDIAELFYAILIALGDLQQFWRLKRDIS